MLPSELVTHIASFLTSSPKSFIRLTHSSSSAFNLFNNVQEEAAVNVLWRHVFISNYSPYIFAQTFTTWKELTLYFFKQWNKHFFNLSLCFKYHYTPELHLKVIALGDDDHAVCKSKFFQHLEQALSKQCTKRNSNVVCKIVISIFLHLLIKFSILVPLCPLVIYIPCGTCGTFPFATCTPTRIELAM